MNKLSQIVPMEGEYRHKPNAHAHILSAIAKQDIKLPIKNMEMKLGVWQRVLLLEFDGPRKRTIEVTIIFELNEAKQPYSFFKVPHKINMHF